MLLLLYLPIRGAQVARSFPVEQVAIEAEILPDASLAVTENITVDFSGWFKGFFVKIPRGDTPIEDISVKENGEPYTFNPGDGYAPPGRWLIKAEGDRFLIDWSIAAADEVRTFEVSYRIIDAVKIHEDTAKLYRKFIGEANGNKIGAARADLFLPPVAGQYKQDERIRICGHGPLTGEMGFSGPQAVTWPVKNLPPYTSLGGGLPGGGGSSYGACRLLV
ncbi:MAG: DUF2207 domain-containing protein [Firmicutes bacterium]|nr:DUF2207 domain-containing protein [Bacillota bacterium]